MYRPVLFCALAALLIASCSATAPDKVVPTPIVEVEAEPEEKSAKLVLVVVLDQLASRAFSRYAPHLPADGVLRRAMETGMYHARVRYGYAGTNTAPGHASIYTGEVPADHGIDSNDVYDYERAARTRIINDGKYKMFGEEGNFASPDRLLKPTLGDRLHEERPGSKVISVSLKGRAAVVSGGKTADFVAWYSPATGAFTTSSYYAESMPAWLETWNRANPASERFAVWNPTAPELLATVNGQDDAPGEEDWHGLGTTFPHDSSKTLKPSKVFMVTPASVTYLFDMARALVSEYKLGEDDIPDLLSVSISSTDYAGHAFGIDSWEYLDILLHSDKVLSAFVAELEAKTDLSVVVTSDHGGTSLAEHTAAAGQPSGRLYCDELVATLEKKADKALGKGNWLEMYLQPYLYLHEDARNSPKREELLALISAYAETDDKVQAIYAAEHAREWRKDKDWLRRAVANNVAPLTEALFVVPAEGHVASPSKGTLGTGHGTPWESDREVPLLALGVGVTKSKSDIVVAQARVAATIASLLGISWHLPTTPLAGAPDLREAKKSR